MSEEPIAPYALAVLGGGPGGYVAALRAAQLGARVALVEKDRVGGTCLNIGCIPTKALTTATEPLLKVKRAAEFGLSIPSAAPDLPAMMDYKQANVDALVAGVEQLLRERRVTLVRGEACLAAPDTLRVLGQSGVVSHVFARRVILAPGSVIDGGCLARLGGKTGGGPLPRDPVERFAGHADVR